MQFIQKPIIRRRNSLILTAREGRVNKGRIMAIIGIIFIIAPHFNMKIEDAIYPFSMGVGMFIWGVVVILKAYKTVISIEEKTIKQKDKVYNFSDFGCALLLPIYRPPVIPNWMKQSSSRRNYGMSSRRTLPGFIEFYALVLIPCKYSESDIFQLVSELKQEIQEKRNLYENDFDGRNIINKLPGSLVVIETYQPIKAIKVAEQIATYISIPLVDVSVWNFIVRDPGRFDAPWIDTLKLQSNEHDVVAPDFVSSNIIENGTLKIEGSYNGKSEFGFSLDNNEMVRNEYIRVHLKNIKYIRVGYSEKWFSVEVITDIEEPFRDIISMVSINISQYGAHNAFSAANWIVHKVNSFISDMPKK